jgi:hypothetical protein
MPPLEAKFPDGSPYAKWKISESDPRYVDARGNAERLGLSQAQFSGLLEHEARRVAAEVARSPPPAAEPKPDYSKMSEREKFAHALQRGAVKPRG